MSSSVLSGGLCDILQVFLEMAMAAGGGGDGGDVDYPQYCPSTHPPSARSIWQVVQAEDYRQCYLSTTLALP